MDMSCEGCQLLDQGIGGENQLAHMNPGGCLWYDIEEEDSFSFSSTLEESGFKNVMNNSIEKDKLKFVDNPHFYIASVCLICKDTITAKNDCSKTPISEKCESCSSKDGINRFIQYQNFVFDCYKNV